MDDSVLEVREKNALQEELAEARADADRCRSLWKEAEQRKGALIEELADARELLESLPMWGEYSWQVATESVRLKLRENAAQTVQQMHELKQAHARIASLEKQLKGAGEQCVLDGKHIAVLELAARWVVTEWSHPSGCDGLGEAIAKLDNLLTPTPSLAPMDGKRITSLEKQLKGAGEQCVLDGERIASITRVLNAARAVSELRAGETLARHFELVYALHETLWTEDAKE